MKDSLFSVLFIIDAPEIRRWGHEVVREAERRRIAPAGELGSLHEAIDDPILFLSRESEPLRDRFWSAYDAVSGDAAHLLLSAQSFAPHLSLFVEDPRSIIDQGRRRRSSHPHRPPPPELDLARSYYPDIAQSAEAVKDRVDELRRLVVGEELGAYLDGLLVELHGLKARATDLRSARERLWEIEGIVGGATTLAVAPEAGVQERIVELLDELSVEMVELPPEKAGPLAALRTVLNRYLVSGVLDEVARGFAAEAHIVLSELRFERSPHRRGEAERRPPTVQELERRFGAEVSSAPAAPDPSESRVSFEELSDLAYAIMAGMAPARAVELLQKVDAEEEITGAAMLDAAFRHRLGAESEPYRQTFAPLVRRVLMRQIGRGRAAARPPLEARGLAEQLEPLIAGGKSLMLEFGGGATPYGALLAARMPAASVVSLDPEFRQPPEGSLPAEPEPVNFLRVQARAEGIAPFAARDAFALGAVMVAPPQSGILEMVLSALLAVREGGSIEIFHGMRQGVSYLEALRAAHIAFSEQILAADDPGLPPSASLQAEQGVRRVQIRVPQLTPPAGRMGGEKRLELKGLAPARRHPQQAGAQAPTKVIAGFCDAPASAPLPAGSPESPITAAVLATAERLFSSSDRALIASAAAVITTPVRKA